MSRQNIKGSMKLMLKQRSRALPRKKVRNFWYWLILTCTLKAEKFVAKEGFASWTSWEPCSSFNVALREEFIENECSQIWIILNVICDILCSSFNDGKQRTTNICLAFNMWIVNSTTSRADIWRYGSKPCLKVIFLFLLRPFLSNFFDGSHPLNIKSFF